MPEIKWWSIVDVIRPSVVQITTPSGSGTGFLFYRARGICAVATAAHVVQYSDSWDFPIRLYHPTSAKTVVLKAADRAILPSHQYDSAAIVFQESVLPLPDSSLGLMTEGRYLKVGNPLGWLGFPAVAPADLCFFRGSTSCFVESEHHYLVDGVAINGVSGGPAFTEFSDEPILVGLVSAYIPNRQTGEALPGLCVVKDVKHLQDFVQRMQSMKQAKEAAEAAKSKETPSPSRGTGEDSPPNPT